MRGTAFHQADATTEALTHAMMSLCNDMVDSCYTE